jgi:hypothetical protein
MIGRIEVHKLLPCGEKCGAAAKRGNDALHCCLIVGYCFENDYMGVGKFGSDKVIARIA